MRQLAWQKLSKLAAPPSHEDLAFLQDCANFLRIRGIFKDVYIEEKTIHAIPEYEEMPSVQVSLRNTAFLEVLITSEDFSFVLNELESYLSNNGYQMMDLFTVATVDGSYFRIYSKQTELIDITSSSLSAIGEEFNVPISTFKTHVIFVKQELLDTLEPNQLNLIIETIIEAYYPTFYTYLTSIQNKKPDYVREGDPDTVFDAFFDILENEDLSSGVAAILGFAGDLHVAYFGTITNDMIDFFENLIAEIEERNETTIEKFYMFKLEAQKAEESEEKEQKKDTTKKKDRLLAVAHRPADALFLKNEPDPAVDLSDREIDVLFFISSRRKKKVQSNILAQKLNMSQEEVKNILRDLVDKGWLKVTSGWYILRPSKAKILDEIQSLEKQIIRIDSAQSYQPMVKNPALAEELGLGRPEQVILLLFAGDQYRSYTRSQLLQLTQLMSYDVDNAIENLQSKGLLEYRTSAYWLTPEGRNVLNKLQRGDQSLLKAIPRALHAIVKKGKTVKTVELDPKEQLVVEALLTRNNLKTQSHLIAELTGLDKEEVKTVLANLTKKGICTVKRGWYALADNVTLKNPVAE